MLVIWFVLAPLLVAQALPSAQVPVNGDFELGPRDGVPQGWAVPPGFAVESVEAGVHRGARCAHLRATGEKTSAPFGNLMQSFDAKPWRSLPIRLRAAIRVAGAETRAQMWLRVDRPNREPGLFDNMDDRPVRSAEWSVHEITGVVDPDAEYLNVGVMLFGPGEVWIDAVELEATGEAVAFVPAEAPRALEERGLANLLAFAELYGYVRHFHPSDEAAAADWDEVALLGVRAVEGARDAAELAQSLQAHLAALAPTVRVFVRGAEPALPTELERTTVDGLQVVRWKHLGFGQGERSIYRSERERGPIGAELACDPAEPYRAELAGGVACLVPLALYADEHGTLPRAEPVAGERPLLRPSGSDRTTRLADVVIAWNVFQHFFPYFDVVEVGWRAELERALRSASTDEDAAHFTETLRRLVAALQDGHGYVSHASRLPAGFLPLDWEWLEERVVVTRVARGSAGPPTPGDVVLAMDDVPMEELFARTEELVSSATPQWRRQRALAELAAPRTTAPVTLTLETYPEGKIVDVKLTPAPTRPELDDSRPPPVSELEPGVWYVDLGRASDADFTKAVSDLADAEGIVFDLRGYPRGLTPETIFGHLIAEPSTSPQWHVPLVTRPNREGLSFERSGEWRLLPIQPLFEAERAFLIGGGAISYAESCLGIVEHYGLAELVGGPTAGTNGNVNPFRLPGGYSISWTGMKVLKHDGSRHHGVGIQPTIPVARTRAGVAARRDEVLERALETVRPQRAR